MRALAFLALVGALCGGVAAAGELYCLPRDFSGTQGANGWYYLSATQPGRYQELNFTNSVVPWGVQKYYCWAGNARYLQITGVDGGAFIQTGEGKDTAVAWQAPRAGVVEVFGMMIATSTANTYNSWMGPKGDDGITFSILKGQTVIAGPARVLHGAEQLQALTAVTPVAPGERIVFYQARGNWQDGDAAYYCFTVHYVDR